MATITVRNLSSETVRALKKLAERNHRSVEQEVRDLIETRVGDRLSALSQIEKTWASQKRAPTADEVAAWIDIQEISGLVPPEIDAEALYREHLLGKHR